MRVLTMQEVECVSGAGFFSGIGAVALGFVGGTIGGISNGAIIGGGQGGFLGVGFVSGAFGALIGGIAGAIGGVTYGLVNGLEKTTTKFNETMDQMFDLVSKYLPK